MEAFSYYSSLVFWVFMLSGSDCSRGHSLTSCMCDLRVAGSVLGLVTVDNGTVLLGRLLQVTGQHSV